MKTPVTACTISSLGIVVIAVRAYFSAFSILVEVVAMGAYCAAALAVKLATEIITPIALST